MPLDNVMQDVVFQARYFVHETTVIFNIPFHFRIDKQKRQSLKHLSAYTQRVAYNPEIYSPLLLDWIRKLMLSELKYSRKGGERLSRRAYGIGKHTFYPITFTRSLYRVSTIIP